MTALTDCLLVVSYDYMSYLFYFFSVVCAILAIVYAFLTFGDLMSTAQGR